MAYDKNKIFEQAKKAIQQNNLFFIEDIVAWIPCNRDTFYRFYPTDSDKYEILKTMLNENKVKTKSSIRAKLFKSNKAAELLALYRLLATPEEHRKLNQQYTEHSGKMNHEITNKVDRLFPKISDIEKDTDMSSSDAPPEKD